MNEELQSTNQELQTMNDELRLRGEELSELGGFMTATLGSLRAGVVVLDKDLLVRAWNDTMTEMWGLRVEEVLGKEFISLDIGFPIEQLASAIRGTLTDEKEVQQMVDCVNRRGKAIRCRVNVTAVKPAPNRGVTIVIEDLASST